jgi:hypothetical protein
MLKVKVWRQSGTLPKKQGSHDLHFRLWGTKGMSKRPTWSGQKGLKPMYYSILFCALYSYPWTMIKFCYKQLLNSDCSEDLLLSHQKCYFSRYVGINNPTMNESYMDNATIDTGFTLKWTVYLNQSTCQCFLYTVHSWALIKVNDTNTDYKISVYRTWTCVNLVTDWQETCNW